MDTADRDVAFVIGPPCSGRLTFIRKRFPEHFLVDIHEFQMQGMGVWESYIAARDALSEAVTNHKKVVLKHALLKAKRRPMHIDAVRESAERDPPIACYYSLPTISTYVK